MRDIHCLRPRADGTWGPRRILVEGGLDLLAVVGYIAGWGARHYPEYNGRRPSREGVR